MRTSLCFILLTIALAIGTDAKPFLNRSYEQRLRNLVAGKEVSDPPEMWFIQKLDHFNHQDNRTWQQRYFVNATFWDQNNRWGGPIFVQIGGEGAISPGYVTRLAMANYAQQYGALMLAVEHRFYGKSQPLPDLSTNNLVYLSSEQALADAANFILQMKTQFGAQDAPVITFGCSYPGALAAWFKLKFPQVALASVASSSPVQATLDFYQYLDVVNASIDYFTGAQCDDRIRQATDVLQPMLQTSAGQQKVQQLFNTCESFTGPNDISVFISDLMGNFQGVVQYNDEGGNPIDIKYVCNIMNNQSYTPLEAYIQVSNLFVQQSGASCLDVSYTNMIQQLTDVTQPTDGVGIRSWTYQTCTEFGYFQTTDNDNQPFGDLVPISFYTQMCQDIFGLPADSVGPNVNQTNEIYGGNNWKPSGATNVLFVNGNIDPWHVLSVTESVSLTVKSILIDGTAHCANVEPPSPNDPLSLVIARKEISIQIQEYLIVAAKNKKL